MLENNGSAYSGSVGSLILNRFKDIGYYIMLNRTLTLGLSSVPKILATNNSELSLLPRTTPSIKYLELNSSLEVALSKGKLPWSRLYTDPFEIG